MKPEDLVRPEILALKAYPVASSDGMVKLDAMENPYPLPEHAAPRARGGACARRRQSLSHAEPAQAARRHLASHEGARRHGGPPRQRLRRADPDPDHGAGAPGRGDDVSVADLRHVCDGGHLQRHARAGGAAARGFLARRRCVHRAHAGGETGAGVPRLSEQSDRRALPGSRCRQDHPRLRRAGGAGRGLPRVRRQELPAAARRIRQSGGDPDGLQAGTGRHPAGLPRRPPGMGGATRQGASAVQRQRAHAGRGAVHARAAGRARGAGLAHSFGKKESGKSPESADRASPCFRPRPISS